MTGKLPTFYQRIISTKFSTLLALFAIIVLLFVATNFWSGDKTGLEDEYLRFITAEKHRLEDEQSQLPFVQSVLLRKTTTHYSNNIDQLFERLNIIDDEAKEFIKKNPNLYAEIVGRSNRHIEVASGYSNKVHRLIARLNKGSDTEFQRYTMTRTAVGFTLKHEVLPLVVKERVAGGLIRFSLFGATDALGLPDNLTIQLAELFSSYIDFYRDLRAGDYFTVVYQSLQADGIPVGAGKILSAEFVNKRRSYSAIWFETEKIPGEYFSFDGQSRKWMYLRAPLKFSRIYSRFTNARFHPILKTWRGHKGVDYAAATGTPIRAIADGEVTFAGVQRGYGNVVYLKHPDTNVSVSAHMSKIKVRKGQKVRQGDIIGLVGATGWATGPHLHFEIRVKGVHVDPLTIVNKNVSRTSTVENNQEFQQLSKQMQAKQQPISDQLKLEAQQL